MHLIDADLLKKNCKRTGKFEDNFKCVSLNELVKVIDEQPTAYDVNRVVKQLEREKSKAELLLAEDVGTGFEFSSKCRLDALIKAIEIMKGRWY